MRWTDLLARETGWDVQNAGENGREIPRRSWEIDDLLHRAEGADLVTILLGGNDLLQGPPFAAEDAAARMEACLTPLLARRAPASILLVGPPPMTLGAWTNQAVCLQSRRLAPCYRALAEGLGLSFADGGQWGVELLFDGVHFSPAGHRAYAAGIQKALSPLAKRFAPSP